MVDDINKKLDYLNETRLLIKEAIQEKGPVINEEDTFRSYVDKIRNIESLDPNTAKIFNSTEEMENDDKVFVGKKAIVYNRDMMPLNRESRITNLDIPESFVLSKAPEQSCSVYYTGSIVGSNAQLYLGLSSSRLELTYQKSSSSMYSTLYIIWTSSDGINYSVSDMNYSSDIHFVFGIFDFGMELSYSNGTWNNLFGEIFKANQSEFHGLYEYTDSVEDRYYANTFNNFKLENSTNLTYDTSPLYLVDLENKIKTIIASTEEGTLDSSYYGPAYIAEYENDIPKTLVMYYDSYLFIDKTQKIIKTTYTSSPSSIPTCTKFVFDLINMTYHKETVTTVIETVNNGSKDYYIATVDDYTNKPILNLYINSNGTLALKTFAVRLLTSSGFVNTSINNIFYKRPRYINAPNQLSNIRINELFEDKTVYGSQGIIKGDKSYLQNIKSIDFYSTWLPGTNSNNYGSYNYSNVLNYGTSVPYQTFVERNQILSSEIKDQNTHNAIVQHVTNLNKAENVLSSSDILYKIYNAHSYYSKYYRYNETVYWLAIGINWSNSDTHEYVQAIYGVLYNAETGERIYDMSDTTKWKPVDTNATEYFCGVSHIAFSHTRNEFIILFDTGTWGWSHGAHGAVYRYNAITKGRSAVASINLGKHGTGTYYQIDSASYDETNNCFFALIGSFDPGGENSKNQYIVKLDSSNNSTVVYTDTSSSTPLYKYNWWTQTNPDRGSIYSYMISSTLKIVNLMNGKVLTLNNVGSDISSSKFVKYKGEYYISYYTLVDNTRTHYVDKLNLSNMTRTNILQFTYDKSSSEYFYFIHVDGELCIAGYNTYKIFDLNLNEKLTLRSDNSPIIYAVAGINTINNQLASEAYYITVNNATEKTLILYKKEYSFYLYKQIETFPIKGELFIVGEKTSTGTRQSTNYMFYSYQLTEQKVNDKQYQQYLDSMDQLLEEE